MKSEIMKRCMAIVPKQFNQNKNGGLEIMKKYLLALVLVATMAVAVPAFAEITDWQGPGFYTAGNGSNVVYYASNPAGHVSDIFVGTGIDGDGGVGDITNTNNNSNKNTNTNINTNANLNNNDNRNTNVNTNMAIGNIQGQKQGQKQSQTQSQSQSQSMSNTQIIEDTKQFLGAPQVIPMPIPLIQGGRVGDVTAQVVLFDIPALPYKGEKVKRVLKVVSGSIFDRVRLEDIEEDLLDAFKGIVDKYGSKDFNLAKVRYLVQYKDSAMGAGVGGGGSASLSGIGGGTNPLGYGATGAILPGYTRSTADPTYIIKFFEIQ
ncbi:hypothetical protein A2Z67_05025 [Candidatus Woesebacteria bacterium RBG_13_36_22]|uniref:Uncharacterized protein n=1 Tax=Candidatus Woesebacteria bacterium RBG_13_36_22 TaxID=1802478 RepID=A0A1F7X2F2_9BACT|nr:MAG: hypothetical protein A2Z67_05025 [Candidatus Woesebacteria bacterium RBG_13_36_22]